MAREMERGRPLPASLSLILLGATVEETAAVFPRQGQTPEPERDERRGRRLAVFTAPFCMRNRFGAKQVGAEVSVLMLRVNRESIRCPLHQWAQPCASAWLADCSTLTDHMVGIKWWIWRDEAVNRGKKTKTLNVSFHEAGDDKKRWCQPLYISTHIASATPWILSANRRN